MKAFKGFNSKLQCTPNEKVFQYEVGKSYEEPTADLCSSGFHACESPLDVFNYYAPADSRYCEVNLDGVSDKTDSDSKRVGKKITIGAETGIPGLAKAHVEYVNEHVDWTNAKESNTGDQSAATNTGNYSAATNTGDQSAASVEGKESVAIATGFESKAKGTLGCWIVLAEWFKDENGDYHIKSVKSAAVDGKRIKADTYYTLKNGRFVEVKG